MAPRKGPKRPDPTQAEDDPLYGCDAMDVSICEAYERNPAASYKTAGEAVGLSPKATQRRVGKVCWKRLWASRHAPVGEIIERAGDLAARRFLSGMARVPDNTLPMRAAILEDRAFRTAERIVSWLLDREQAAAGIGAPAAFAAFPLPDGVAAELAKFFAGANGGRPVPGNGRPSRNGGAARPALRGVADQLHRDAGG